MDFITEIYELITKFIVDLLITVGIDPEKIPDWLTSEDAE